MWKKVNCVHESIAKSFQAITRSDQEVPFWFTEGKTSLIPKAGEFSSENQRPITCLNTIYKWFTSCLLKPVDKHLNENGLMQGEQSGAKANCSGTIDNLLIHRMVCQYSQRGHRNLSMAWIDVKKAYDSVDHRWLEQMFYLHRFPRWIDDVITRLSAKWNSKIAARIVKRMETSERIRFSKGLPQGDALCPRLFTISINPLAWKLRASEGYRLSRPISQKVTDLLYIDDLMIYAASQGKLQVVMSDARMAMEDIGLACNERKCAVADVKRAKLETSDESIIGEEDVIESLKKGSQYKFLGILENVNHEDNLVLQNAEKVYLDRLSVLWSSPLSDYNKVLATNLPALTYFMWTQVWTIVDLQRLDIETRKVMVVNGAKHPLSSTDLLYLPRKLGGRGLKSIEREYKTIKIKAAMNLYSNNDPAIHLVRQFEEKAARTGSRPLLKDAESYAKQLGLRLEFQYPQSVGVTEAGNVIDRKKFSGWSKKVNQSRGCAEIESERWQGKLIAERWRDEDVDEECFAWKD